MSNEVLNSLEEADNGSRYKNVKGGAYSYKLTYEDVMDMVAPF